MHQYIHPVIGEQIRAIGGEYTTVKERLLPVGTRQALVAIIVGRADTSCCGGGGCVVADVPGYVVEYHADHDAHGNPVTVVEPITDGDVQQRIAQQIRQAEKVQDVRFWSPNR